MGNEHGFAYETTWSNLLRDSVYAGMPEYADKYAKGQEDGSHWVPAEADVSIRPGWYYHEYEDHKVKTLPQLLDIYYKSIGRNASLLINFPVDRRGLIHEKDEEQILKLKAKIDEDFADDLSQTIKASASNERGSGYEANKVLDGSNETFWATKDGVIQSHLAFLFDKPTWVNRFMIQEHIPLGQRIKKFSLEGQTENGWELIAEGTTIGAKRILKFDDIEVKQLRLNVLDAKAEPVLSSVGIYLAPKLVTEPVLHRKKSGEIALEVSDHGVEIFYTLDGSTPDTESLVYEIPLMVDQPITLKTIAMDRGSGRKSEVMTYVLDIPKAQWKVLSSDVGAEKAIDEDPQTFWKSDDNELVIDLGEVQKIYGFTYLPPQNRYMSGIISQFLFQGSMDGEKWDDLEEGEFSNIHNNPVEQRVTFSQATVRYVKLKAKQTSDGQKASFGEVGIITIQD